MRHESRGASLARLIGVLLFASALGGVRVANATVVERIVAVIGDKPILLSDLRKRARPFLLRVYEQAPGESERSAAISQVYKAILGRMVDEELQRRAAARMNLSVNAREIDDALNRIAANNNLTREKVVAEAGRVGMTEQQYRDELGRQILEAKLMNLHSKVRVSEEDLRNTYRESVMDERRALGFRIASIVIRVPATAEVAKQKRSLIESVADQARRGRDFAELARRFSEDPNTAKQGGLLPTMRPGQLPKVIDQAALALEVGEVSAPIRDGDRLVVIKLIERDQSRLPPYEQAREELAERVYMQKMETAKRQWLDGLRKRTHVEMRL